MYWLEKLTKMTGKKRQKMAGNRKYEDWATFKSAILRIHDEEI